jgi:hypothetical protein
MALGLAAIAMLAALVLAPATSRQTLAAGPANSKRLDPAAWGADHVGQPIPEYMESGECLFCHRAQVGVSWQANKHNRTMREPEANDPALAALKDDAATKALAEQVELILGDTRAQRFLKRSKGYGRVDVLSTAALFGRGRRAKLDATENPHWDTELFADQCAGCHATAVNPETHAFSALSLDCFACHGDAPGEHANDPKLMPLAKARKDSAAAVTSICASCHVRFGKSKASGLPYPTNFVAGDNLFKDFEVDFGKADDNRVNPADRHVLDNVREVVVHGRETMTCLSCHDVHSGSSKRHRDLPVEQYCQHCHDAGQPIKGHKAYEVHSDRCRY